jgi:hypothetical protein
VDIETRYKSEIARGKKGYESTLRELEMQNETLSRSNSELAKANKSLAGRVKVICLLRAPCPEPTSSVRLHCKTPHRV